MEKTERLDGKSFLEIIPQRRGVKTPFNVASYLLDNAHGNEAIQNRIEIIPPFMVSERKRKTFVYIPYYYLRNQSLLT